MRIRFAPRLVPTLAAFAMIALTVWLGRWQLDRAQEKAERQALLDARSAETVMALGGSSGPADSLLYRRVRVAGRWQPQAQIFIDNRIHQGQAGFEVITPLEIAGSDRVVLVDRGWIARSRDYPAPPAVATPQGDAEVSGVAVLPPRRYLELSQETVSGNVWQNLSLDRYAERMRMKLLPVVVRAEPPSNGLALAAERPDFGIARHREYALTWFSLAATVAALWLFFSFGRHPR